MKRLLVSALLALAGLLLLAGCGGGSGSKARGAHGTAKVTLKIAIPDRLLSKLKAQSATQPARTSTARNKRLIPSNAVNINISYSTVDGTGAVVAAPTVTVSIATPQPIPINDLAAGIANTIVVTLDDGTATLASGSTTVNIAPNPTPTQTTPVTSINITLQSTVTGTVNYTLDGIAVTGTPVIGDSATHTLRVVSINNTDLPTPQPVATINAARLRVTVSPNLAVTGLNPDGSIIAADRSFSIRQLRSGAATITVTYSEPFTANGLTSNQNIKTDALTITLQTILFNPAPVTPIQNANATPLNINNLFDVAEQGYALFYDPTELTPVDIQPGYSRIRQYLLAGTPPTLTGQPDAIDFDLPTPPPLPPPARFTGAGSRVTTYTVGLARFWAVVSAGGAQISALPAGQSRYSATTPPTAPLGGWNHLPPAGYVILDADSKDLFVYLLERNGTAFQIERIRQTDGTQVDVTVLNNLGFAPTRIAAISLPSETDYYLSGGSRLAQLRVGSTQGLNANFTTFSVTSTVADIATSGADSRFVYVLTTDPGGNGVSLVSTLDGTPVALNNTVSTLQTLATGATGLSLAASGNNIYVLEQPATPGAQIEGFQLQ